MKINVFHKARTAKNAAQYRRLFKKAVLQGLGKNRKKAGEVNLVLVDKSEIKKINRKFLGKNRITDVIAFNHPSCRTAAKETAPFGDIFICVDQARAQAKAVGNTFLEELITLAGHGALHLAGMDDKTAKQRAAMDKCCAKILKKLGF